MSKFEEWFATQAFASESVRYFCKPLMRDCWNTAQAAMKVSKSKTTSRNQIQVGSHT